MASISKITCYGCNRPIEGGVYRVENKRIFNEALSGLAHLHHDSCSNSQSNPCFIAAFDRAANERALQISEIAKKAEQAQKGSVAALAGQLKDMKV